MTDENIQLIQELEKRIAYERLVAQISAMAVNLTDISAYQNSCMRLIGKTTGIDRAYIFKYCYASNTVSNTHEWCAPGIEPQIDNMQKIDQTEFAWLSDSLRKDGIIHFQDIEQIADHKAKTLFRQQNILSILNVPMIIKDELYGFMGFDSCKNHRLWPEEDIELLKMASRIISDAIAHFTIKTGLIAIQQQMLSIFDSITDPVYVADTETYEILFANKHMKQMLQQEAIGEKCYKAIQNLDSPCPFCTNRILAERDPEPYRWEFFNQNVGRHYSICDRLIEWPDGRKVRLELTTDITEHKKAEERQKILLEELAQSRKIESIGRLAGGIAHDFNNMLGVIIGHCELILHKSAVDTPLVNHIKEIRKAASKSADLTRQLLAFARKQTIDPKILDINLAVANLLRMLRRLIGEDIDLVWQPGDDIWQIKMDPVQIDQILTNLCLNARDAVTENGRITIETENVKFDETRCSTRNGFLPGNFVMLAVSDNGRGMSPDVIDKIFEPFFTTKELGQGTGLGLATTYGIVKQNNGFINVYSEPGRGTTFKVYLPRQHSKDAVSESPTDVSDEKVTGGTILVVEDEKSLLDLNTDYLESIGYRVLPTTSPAEALKIAAVNDIDLLLTDVVMPEMNGRVLFEKIAAIKPGVKVLFVSGYTSNVIIHQGILEKDYAYMQKPFSLKALEIRLSEILNR